MAKLSLKGFKDFLLKNNLIEVATGLVIATAFTALVTAFTTNIIQPLINTLAKNHNNGLTYQIVAGDSSTIINFSAIITAVINFIIIAAVIYYLVIVPYSAAKKRQEKDAEPAPEITDLLVDIKKILQKQARN